MCWHTELQECIGGRVMDKTKSCNALQAVVVVMYQPLDGTTLNVLKNHWCTVNKISCCSAGFNQECFCILRDIFFQVVGSSVVKLLPIILPKVQKLWIGRMAPSILIKISLACVHGVSDRPSFFPLYTLDNYSISIMQLRHLVQNNYTNNHKKKKTLW